MVTELLLVVASGLNGSNRRPSGFSATLSCLESGLDRVGAAPRGEDELSAKPTATHTPNTSRFIIGLLGKRAPSVAQSTAGLARLPRRCTCRNVKRSRLGAYYRGDRRLILT